MRTIQQIIADMEACQKSMETALAKAKSAQNDDEKRGYQSLVSSAKAEFETLKAELEDAKALEATRSIIAVAKALNAPQDQHINLNPPEFQTVATPTNVEKDARAKSKFFMTYVADGPAALAGQAFESIRSKSEKIVGACKSAVAIPEHIAAQIITGKAMLSSDTTGGATDSGGNNLVPPNYIPEVLSQPVYIPMLADRTRKVPAAGGLFEYPTLDQTQGNFGGVAFEYKTEGQQAAETTPVFGTFSGVTKLLFGYTEASRIMLSRSAIQLESYITQLFRDAVRMKLSRDILFGNGTTEIEGLLVNASVTSVPRNLADAVGYVDLGNLQYAVSKGNRTGAMWILADAVEKHLSTQVDNLKRPLFAMDMANAVYNRLRGLEYDTHEFSDLTLGDAGDVLFGNLNNYALGIEMDMAIDRSEHVKFLTGGVVFRLMMLVGGKVIFPGAFAKLTAQTA